MRLVELFMRVKEYAQIGQTYDRAESSHRVGEGAVLPRLAIGVLADLKRRSLNKRYVLRVARYQQYDAVFKRNVRYEVESFGEHGHGFFEIYYVCVYSCAKYVIAHPRTSQAGVMTVMASCSSNEFNKKKLLKFYSFLKKG